MIFCRASSPGVTDLSEFEVGDTRLSWMVPVIAGTLLPRTALKFVCCLGMFAKISCGVVHFHSEQMNRKGVSVCTA